MGQECVGQLSGMFCHQSWQKGFPVSFRLQLWLQNWSWRRRHRHPGVGEGTAAGKRQPGPHTRALALPSTAASHDKGLFLFAVSHGKHSSRAEQKQSLEDTRSLNCLHAKIIVQWLKSANLGVHKM